MWLLVSGVEIAGIQRWERLSYNHPNQLHGSGVVLITIHLCTIASKLVATKRLQMYPKY